MAFFDDLMARLDAMWDRAHIFTFSKTAAAGVHPRFTRDLRPLPETGVTGGDLLELYTVIDELHAPLDASSRVRLDVLEEDWLFTGGLDDRVVSLLGTGAVEPEPGAPVRRLATQVHDLPEGRDVAWFVEEYKRTSTDFQDTILVVRELPAGGVPGTRRTHVLGWLRLEHDDIGAVSELYFVLDCAGRFKAASPVLEIGAAPPGVSVRLRGTAIDQHPLAAGAPEPLDEIPVTLGRRRAVSGEGGSFVIDARLPMGDHVLRFSRTGIEPRDLTVRVTADAAGTVTAAVLDGANRLDSATTPEAATALSVLELELPSAVALRVHKLRGTVLWPDSRTGNVAANYRGTPLAERRVYVLPLPAGGTIADRRPRTTREWEALKRTASVLRSTRPGRPAQAERTDFSGRFEVKYVDFTAGSRLLVWVERFDPRNAADTTTETPDHIVRTFRHELIQLHHAALTTWGRASDVQANHRNLVDHLYTALTGDAVPVAVEALRVADLPAPAGRTLVRPQQTTRAGRRPSQATRVQFETLAALAPDTGDNLPVPATRTVGTIAAPAAPVQDGLELHVLPLVPVYEADEAQGAAARRAADALARTAATAFADYDDIPDPANPAAPRIRRLVGQDRGAVRVVLDTSRLNTAVDLGAGAWDATHDPNDAAKLVKLLETTFVVRPQLGDPPLRLGVEDARWHIDAVSLADTALVAVRNADPRVRARRLGGHVHPVLGALAPVLPGLAAPGRVYLAPGHGLWPQAGQQASVNPANWRSNRGGYAENAGEDEVDALVAVEARRLLATNGARVRTCRELDDFTRPGVSNVNSPLAANRFPVVAAADFPRLWQQNPVYFLGARLDPAVHGSIPIRSPQDDKNDHGIMARGRQVDTLAQARVIDLIFAPHTNGIRTTAAPGQPAPQEGNSRGMLVEHLNVETQAGGEGNPMGLGLSTRAVARMAERCNTRARGVFQMSMLNPGVVGDLRDTFDHWVLDDANLPGVNELRRRDPPGPVPAGPNQPPSVVASWNALNDPPGPQGPPAVPAPAANRAWSRERFPSAGLPLEVPSSLAELAFHDNREDAKLLGRAWFRRLAAEGATLAIDAQLQAAGGEVKNGAVRGVLERAFGQTPAVTGLPGVATDDATPASIRAALRTAANPDPAVPAPPNATLGALSSAVLTAARALPRRQLVELMRDALRDVAGWQATDTIADLDVWIAAPITGGVPLERPGDPPTRAEAGMLACRAVGLAPMSLATAEGVAVGTAASPLVRPAPGSPEAYFPRIEADLLLARLTALRPQDVHRIGDVWLADARGSPLPQRHGSGHYDLDPGAPVVVVVETRGAAWKTPNQAIAAARLDDLEIHVEASGPRRRLPCGFRDALRAASTTWILDLPPAPDPADLTVELSIRHRTAGLLRVGTKGLRLRVRELPAP